MADESSTKRAGIALKVQRQAKQVIDDAVAELSEAGVYQEATIVLKSVNGILSMQVIRSQSYRYDS